MSARVSSVAAVALSAFLAVSLTSAARAQVSDQERTVAKNEKGDMVTIPLQKYKAGRQLFNRACAECHQGGINRLAPWADLSSEHLAKAVPNRNNLAGLVDYMKRPTSTDGETDISLLHPSTTSSDIFPTMRGLQENDLEAIAGFILTEPNRLGPNWGGNPEFKFQ